MNIKLLLGNEIVAYKRIPLGNIHAGPTLQRAMFMASSDWLGKSLL